MKNSPLATATGTTSASCLPASPTPASGTAGKWFARGGIVLLAVLLWLPRLSGPIDLRYDAGVYFLLGVSLAEGHGYRILSEPGNPQAVQYPPALPALVALHAKAFGTTDPLELGRWLRRTYFVLSVALALAVLALARTQLSTAWAAFAAALCIFQLNTYLLSDLLFSELPFALVSVCFGWIMLRPVETSRSREPLGFALASLAFLLRTAGVALLAAWVADAFLRRRWRLFGLRAGLAILPVALWQFHVSHVRHSPEYSVPAYAYQRAPYQFYNVTYAENIALVDPFRPELGKANVRTLLSRFLANVPTIPNSIGEAVSTSFGFWRWGSETLQDALIGSRPLPSWLARIPLWTLAVLTGIGLTVMAVRRQWVIPVYVVGSIALVCSTPWPGQFGRYVAPLSAHFAVALCVGVQWIRRAVPSRDDNPLRKALPVLLGGLAALTLAAQVFTGFQVFSRRQSGTRMPAFRRPEEHHVFYHDGTWTAWEKSVAWIKDHAKPDDVIATVSPHLCYLWTGRKSIFPPMEANAATARALLEAVPVAFVIVDQLEFLDIARIYGGPAVSDPSSGWRVVYQFEGTQVYARAESSSAGRP